ncbi:hypothetical protein [Nocardioides marmorisolisilvae]|uniref:Integral membrane protein n=1 Tax=Nocardioides marmorisolisilvae TaxID=1542737 RepID=A0A3N0DSX3_9ACTN|nr:hypothetical protein [Nocardioides marmorisolisilvae]RNL78724.1 hypothetical protein EFL95_06475 [Nocardioides marmorisolisilvae]
MNELQVVLSVLAALVALVLVWHIVRDEQVTNVGFFGLVALQVGLVVQLVWGVVRVADNHDGVSVAAYLAYLIGALLILPVAFLWSASEKSRSGTAVLLVGVLVLPVLFLRLHDLWSAHV